MALNYEHKGKIISVKEMEEIRRVRSEYEREAYDHERKANEYKKQFWGFSLAGDDENAEACRELAKVEESLANSLKEVARNL